MYKNFPSLAKVIFSFSEGSFNKKTVPIYIYLNTKKYYEQKVFFFSFCSQQYNSFISSDLPYFTKFNPFNKTFMYRLQNKKDNAQHFNEIRKKKKIL